MGKKQKDVLILQQNNVLVLNKANTINNKHIMKHMTPPTQLGFEPRPGGRPKQQKQKHMFVAGIQIATKMCSSVLADRFPVSGWRVPQVCICTMNSEKTQSLGSET